MADGDRRLTRTLALALGALALVVAMLAARLGPAMRHPIVAMHLIAATPSSHLPVPVEGVTPDQITDSWGSPRSGGRGHEGCDIFAPRNTPIHSATPPVSS